MKIDFVYVRIQWTCHDTDKAHIISVYLLECREGKGVDYRGTEAKTRKGVKCQKWADNSPHKPK